MRIINFSFREFFKAESASGIILLLTLIIALLLANSPFAATYQKVIHFPILSKSLLWWINDGFMTIFFMLLALEIKREMIVGHLTKISQIILPCGAALGGILMPALIFITINHKDPASLIGWAIPTATDVALALGIVLLLGKRVPTGLKVFLVVLAIFDDITAIAFIALFYTRKLEVIALLIAALGIGILIIINYLKVNRLWLYLLTGLIIWLAVLKSGIHATLAGVAIGFCIPFGDQQETPLRYLEQKLQPWVGYIILPLFALTNAGVSFDQLQWQQLLKPVPLGIGLGLFIGKQLGIFSFSWLLIKSGFAQLPEGANWRQLYGIAVLAGIGFTMSLFIDNLAYTGTEYAILSKAGILLGSFLSAIVGIAILFNAKISK